MMKTSKVFKIVSSGGLGDALLTTPVFRSIKLKHPESKIVVYCVNQGHYDIYSNNPFIDKLKIISFWTLPLDMTLHFFRPHIALKKYHVNNYGSCVPSKGYAIHSSAMIAELIGVELAEQRLEIYLKKEEETRALKLLSKYSNPIIINITSQTSANQHWPVENWEELIRTMPEYTFIQLGLKTEKKINGAIDMRGETTLRESIAILKYAKSFLGVVSFMAHATNTVDLPGVVLYGPSTPQIWGHKNNINLYKNLQCAPCIDVLLKSKCPYGCICMKEISVAEVKDSLLKQMSIDMRKS